MTTDKISYVATAVTITCTINSMPSSTTGVGRWSAVVDNTTNLYDDALVTVTLKTGVGTPANDKAGYIYVYGSADGATYNGSGTEGVGTDAAVTVDNPTNLKGPQVIVLLNTGVIYKTVFNVANFFGGVMPMKWGVVIVNVSGVPLSGTLSDNTITYTGIYYTNA